MTKKTGITILLLTALTAIIGVCFLPPIPQDLAYHDFVDKRPWLGIPNFGDVAGNLAFLVFGLIGLYQVNHTPIHFTMRGEKTLWRVFFLGAALVGFGSSYYHLEPDNATLVWDRLPMTIAFMSFFSLVIMERVNERTGLLLAPLLLLAGIASVWYWQYTESLGKGDLRPYVLVQFLPLLLIPLMLWLFPPRYTGLKYLGLVVAWYILAKLLEHYDMAIFHVLEGKVSGHTLKHLAAAMSVYTMVVYVGRRLPPLQVPSGTK